MPVRVDDPLTPPQLESTRISMPRMDPRAAAAPARALGSLAQSVSDISSAFAQHADQLQRIDDGRITAQRQSDYSQAFAEAQQKIRQENDPGAIVGKTREWLAANPIQTGGMSREGAADLQNWHTRLSSQAIINAGSDSSLLATRQLNTNVANLIERAKADRDPAALHQALAIKEKSTGLPPEQKKEIVDGFWHHAEGSSLDERTQSDPKGVLHDLQDRNENGFQSLPLTEAARSQLIEKSNLRIEELRAGEFEAARKRIDDPRDRFSVTRESGNFLSDGDRDMLMKYAGGAQPPPDSTARSWNGVGQLHTGFLDHTVSPVAYARAYNDTRSALLLDAPKGLQKEIQPLLDYLSPANREKNPAYLESANPSELELAATSQLNRYLADGAFGNMQGSDLEKADAQRKFSDARRIVVGQIRAKKLTEFPQVTDYVASSTIGDRATGLAKRMWSAIPGSGRILLPPLFDSSTTSD